MQDQSNYETLRSWYLAKLRKSAIEAQVSGQLTPSALIAADREVIEKLIAEREESDEPKLQAARKNKLDLIKLLLLLWLYLIAASLISLFMFCLGDASIFPDVLALVVNPANLSSPSGNSSPSLLVLIIMQAVLYVYPIVAFPFALLSGR